MGIAFESITERKRVEELLLVKDAALDSSLSGMAISDLDGKISYANPAWLRMHGYDSVDEVMGTTPLHHVQNSNEAEVAIQVIKQAGYWNGEVVCRRRDGSFFTAELSCSLMSDAAGLPVGMMASFQDITERKQAEQSLSLAARRAEALLELPSVAETLDEASFMQRGQELAEELTGSQIAFIHFVHDDQETIELVTWSRATLKHYCKAAFDSHYPASKAGVWADALRQRVPVVINDYANYPKKRGLPEGHAHLERMISVPVIEGGLVRMITGVGNKPGLYSDMDVETVRLIGETIWRIVSKKRMGAKAERQLAELQQWYEVMLGREERVLELKREADALRQRLGEAPRYAVELTDDSAETPPLAGTQL